MALLVLTFNAFVLQMYAQGVVSGILGDFATCFVLPVILVSSYEWVTYANAEISRVPWVPASAQVRVACTVIAALYYLLLEVSADFGSFHAHVMSGLNFGRPVTVTRDPWDLLALPMAFVAWRWMRPTAE